MHSENNSTSTKKANASQGKTFQNNLNKNVLNIVSNPKAIGTNKTNNWGILNCPGIKIKGEYKSCTKIYEKIFIKLLIISRPWKYRKRYLLKCLINSKKSKQ